MDTISKNTFFVPIIDETFSISQLLSDLHHFAMKHSQQKIKAFSFLLAKNSCSNVQSFLIEPYSTCSRVLLLVFDVPEMVLTVWMSCLYNIKMLIFVALALLQIAACFNTASPTWIADNSFRAGYVTLISSLTSAPFSQNYNIFFSRVMYSSPAQIAIGMKSYKGNDYLLQEFFALSLVNTFNSYFVVQITLAPITTPLIYEMSYIAIESDYQHANAFSCMPLNLVGSLTNISTLSASKQTQIEVIDYTGNEYYYSATIAAPDSFSTPLSQNVICFFLSALYITSTTAIKVQIDVAYTILDANTYQMSVTAGNNLTISRIEFSKFIYNTNDFSMGARSYMVSYDWNIANPLVTTTFSVPQTILNNQLIVGLKSFYTTTGQTSLSFQWLPGTYSGYYGLQMVTSSSLASYVMQVLYYLEWTCPTGYPYTNFVTFLCQDSCAPYQYPDPVNLICLPCNNTICYTCSGANSNICLSCATNFVLASGNCSCDQSANSLVFVSNSICYLCSDLQSKCISCDYPADSSLPYDSTQFTCLDCNNTAGYFINPSAVCVVCSVGNCTTCATYNTCSICNSGYGVNSSGLCSTCPIDNCAACYNLTACKTCQTPYVVLNYACSLCPASCTCGGYTFPRKSNGDCSAICGDGIIISAYEQCDDNNTLDGDGCSSSCQIEANSSCSGLPSLCYLTINFNASLVSSYGVFANCNEIVFNFQLTPYILFFTTYAVNWSQLIEAQSAALVLVPGSFTASQGLFSLTYTYNQTIQRTNINFTFTPSAIIGSSPYLSKTAPFNVTVKVDPSNDLAAVYCSAQLIATTSVLNKYLTAQNTIAYIGLFLSVFSLKIVGLQMFGAMQISYLILSDYDYINPVFRQILGRNEVNGINVGETTQSNPLISNRVVYNGYNSQIFLKNFNIMFYITIGLIFAGFAMYSITYFLNKSAQQSQLNDSIKDQSLQSQHSKANDQNPQKQPKSIMFHRFSKYLLKEVLMTFVIFNMLNMSFSAGLQMKYINVVEPSSIIAMLVSFMIVIALFLAQIITDKLEFGQYVNKFNQESSQSKYMIITALYRFTLGLLMALLNEWNESGIVFTFISGAFLTYIFYCEPFVDQPQNIRSKAVHCVHVLIMFINYYYRQQANFDEVEASYFLFPAYLQITAVGAVVFGSTIMLTYQIGLKIKQLFTKSKEPVDQGQNIFEGMQAQNNPVQQIQTLEVQQLQP